MSARFAGPLTCIPILLLAALAPAAAQQSRGPVKICRGVPVPDGYVVLAETTSPDCAGGAYLIKREGAAPAPPASGAAARRPRRVGGRAPLAGDTSPPTAGRPPVLAERAAAPAHARGEPAGYSPAEPEEVGEGDVVKVNTTLISVPVSVTDRQGRTVPGLRKQDFRLFEDGVEQEIAHFDPTEKPFTVALVLDTSASTRFRLFDIKEAAVAFTRQLRPEDKVLVVTFNEEVLLLTEATNDREVISAVITFNARTGASTRLYDAVDLVIRERLNKIEGRKAIVLFTDGVDTASHLATYESTLNQAEELDALIFPIQYDTFDDMQQQYGGGSITVSGSRWPFPGGAGTSVRIYGGGIGAVAGAAPGLTRADYERAGRYLRSLAESTGAGIYRADNPEQLSRAFSAIAEELRRQYSLGYYPKTPPPGADERREIKVRMRRPDLVTRAREGYVSAGGSR